VSVVDKGRDAESSMATAGPGQFVVAWDSNGQDGSGYGVFGRRRSSRAMRSLPGAPERDFQDEAALRTFRRVLFARAGRGLETAEPLAPTSTA